MRERSTKQEQEQADADAVAARNPVANMFTGIVATYDQLMFEACVEYDAWIAAVRNGKARSNGWSRDNAPIARLA